MGRPPLKIKEGTRFGELTYLRDAFITDEGRRYGVFLCSCGKETIANISSVKIGKTATCGHTKRVSEAITDDEKQRMASLISIMSMKKVAAAVGHDPKTIKKALGIEDVKRKEEAKEGFFNVDEYFKSDFILQS